MRYKGTFQPSYILDPESLGWDLLDAEFKQKLDERNYVSLSHDRDAGVPVGETQGSTTTVLPSAKIDSDLETTKGRSQMFADNKDLEFDSEESENEDAEIPEGSLFDYNIPGVLKKEDVAGLDLGHWKLLVRDALIELEVEISLTLRQHSLITCRIYVAGMNGQLTLQIL